MCARPVFDNVMNSKSQNRSEWTWISCQKIFTLIQHDLPILGIALVQLSLVTPQLLAQSGDSCVPPPPGMVAWWPGDGFALDVVGTNLTLLK